MSDRRTSCDAFLASLGERLDGTLAGAEREAALAHRQECADCAELADALAAEGADAPDLCGSILARTSGSACDRAQPLLCARLDGELDALDAQLLVGHVRGCAECATLGRVLERMAQELPLLAHADPGPWFVERVLARTSRRPRREPWAVRLGAAVSRWLERPRVALEGAFLATALIVIPLLAPSSPVSDLPERVAELPREIVPVHRRALGYVRSAVGDLQLVVEDSLATAPDWTSPVRTAWSEIRERVGTLASSAASDEQGGGADTNDGSSAAARENEP